ncbi:MAG TPA: carbon monoxide dehydrogenase subunit G [Candidatus Acidoferrales bacterium]|nr:carbon monoxide dehydrogenase subunit G [Candidatus Acidoferrales bacterium]
MKVEGAALLPASRERVWRSLTSPDFLAKCLPGAQELKPDGPGRYKVSLKMGIAAFSGKFEGAVRLADEKAPESFQMSVEGRGAPGFMKGEGTIALRENQKTNQTEVRYSGEAQVGGVIASVGNRMIEAAAKKIIQQFFDAAASQLAAEKK